MNRPPRAMVKTIGYMWAVRYADSDVGRLAVITKTCIVFIGLSSVSTTHPYPANSLAGGQGGAGLALRDPKEKPLEDNPFFLTLASYGQQLIHP